MRSCAVADLLEAGDHAQCRRLAAARGTDEDEELLVLDLEVEIVDGGHLAVAFGDVVEGNRGHAQPPRTVVSRARLRSNSGSTSPSNDPKPVPDRMATSSGRSGPYDALQFRVEGDKCPNSVSTSSAGSSSAFSPVRSRVSSCATERPVAAWRTSSLASWVACSVATSRARYFDVQQVYGWISAIVVAFVGAVIVRWLLALVTPDDRRR